MNFGNVVDNVARNTPDARAVGDPERQITYAELSVASNAAANVFAARGVKSDDRVAICLQNRVTFLTAYLGAMKHGAVPVPVNTRFTDEQIHYVLDTSDSSVIVTDQAFESVATHVETRANRRRECGCQLPHPARGRIRYVHCASAAERRDGSGRLQQRDDRAAERCPAHAR